MYSKESCFCSSVFEFSPPLCRLESFVHFGHFMSFFGGQINRKDGKENSDNFFLWPLWAIMSTFGHFCPLWAIFELFRWPNETYLIKEKRELCKAIFLMWQFGPFLSTLGYFCSFSVSKWLMEKENYVRQLFLVWNFPTLFSFSNFSHALYWIKRFISTR